MDINTYNTIIAEKEKTEDPSKRKKARSGYTTAEIAFKKDLLRDKVVWHNKKCKDWCAYVKLNHPLFSICCVPKEHPFSKCERAIVFFIILGFSALMGLFISIIFPGTDIDFDQAFKDPGYWAAMEGISFAGGLVVTILEKQLEICATCACCQKNSCPKCCRRLFECIGSAFLLIWFIGVAGECAGISILVFTNPADYNPVAYGLGLAQNLLFGWFIAFFKMGFCFNRKWKAEKENKKNKLNKLKVNYVEYELYVNGNQVEIPPNYRPSRTSTIGSIGSASEAGAGRTSTVGSASPPMSPVSTSPRSQSTASVQMSPTSQTIYVDANGNPIQMAPESQPTIVYVQQPPVASSVASSYKGKGKKKRPVVAYK